MSHDSARAALWLRFACLVLLLACAVPAAPAWAQGEGPGAAAAARVGAAPDGERYLPGELVVGWSPEADRDLVPVAPATAQSADDPAGPAWQAAAQALAARTGLRPLALHILRRAARLQVAPGSEEAQSARLRALPWVSYAEPNYIARAARIPTDPRYADQWAMPLVNAPAAWDMTTGTSGSAVVVAVIDSGVDGSHPDLTGRVLQGYNYVAGNLDTADDYGHGTHVAGIIAAGMDNGFGVAGLAPGVQILPYKVLDSSGSGSYDNIAQAIDAAVIHSARVINLSLGGYEASDNLRRAVERAVQSNVLVVAAAGNCGDGAPGCPAGQPLFYPAAYADPQIYPTLAIGVLAVAASSRWDTRASYSNQGSYVSLAAPGGTTDLAQNMILSTWPASLSAGAQPYRYDAGTSMAAPMVSAAAALFYALMPFAPPVTVAQALVNSAAKVGPLPYDPTTHRNDAFGYGRLDVSHALRSAAPPSLSVDCTLVDFPFVPRGTTTSGRVLVANPSNQVATWQARVVDGTPWLTVSPGNSSPATYDSPGVLTLSLDASLVAPGVYSGTVEVRGINPAGSLFTIPIAMHVPDHVYGAFLPVFLGQR